jgi:EthD domain
VVGLFKRKPGLSMEEFKNYYENNHIKLFEEHISHPGVLRYSRRYLEPFEGLALPLAAPKSGGYDVIMEVWYSNKELFDSFKGQSNPDFSDIVRKDEEKLFDRDSMVMFLAEDHESKDGPWVV